MSNQVLLFSRIVAPIVLGFVTDFARAHEVNVHGEISVHAASNATNLRSFLEDAFGSGKGENGATTPTFPVYQGVRVGV